jgi:hypothetical protein
MIPGKLVLLPYGRDVSIFIWQWKLFQAMKICYFIFYLIRPDCVGETSLPWTEIGKISENNYTELPSPDFLGLTPLSYGLKKSEKNAW